MNTFVQQVFEILTTAPGSLIYHLILVFSIAAALQVTITAHGNRQVKSRLLTGLGVLLAGQILLFIISGLVWQGVLNSRSILPPLDRILSALSLTWIIWMWVFPLPRRVPDVIHAVLNLVILLLALFTFTAWNAQSPLTPFNLSLFDIGWNAFLLLMAIIGIVALAIAHPAGWGLPLAMLLLSIAGSAYHLGWMPPEGDFAPAIRIAAICAYPLLPGLALILQSAGQPSPFAIQPAEQSNGFIERRRYNAEPRAFYAWLQLAVEENPQKVYPALTHAVAQSMLSDLCLFIVPSPSTRDLVIQSGWDLIRDEAIQTNYILEQTSLPAITNALQRGRSITLDPTSHTNLDLTTLNQALGLAQIHSLLFIPINAPQKALGGIALLSIYSKRDWSAEDQSYLLTAVDGIARLIHRTESIANQTNSQQAWLEEVNRLKAELEQLQAEKAAGQPEGLLSQSSAQMEDLLALHNESQSLIAELRLENQDLQTQVQQLQATAAANLDERSLQQIAELKDRLSIAQSTIKDLQRQQTEQPSGGALPARQLEKLSQVLTSVIGYTDLLLSETTGALSALQQNFLERIRTATAQMKELLETHTPTQGAAPAATVNITDLIDEAVMEMRPHLREKDLNLRVDLPLELPLLHTDPEAFRQVVVNLLKNAVLVSSQEGNINLVARVDLQAERPSLLIQITDFGGGIPARELSRVFSRPLNGDPSEIEGVGENGAGLAIAKTLVEANAGRIWVESQPNVSTTFYVLMPFNAAPETSPLTPTGEL
ncbi:MAG: GAF domain-containing sensor histidine kinase [Chloroflexi bacterium]|nr:GAF domain-containing sensor histidine kinase [Chloroflexota bacterium]